MSDTLNFFEVIKSSSLLFFILSNGSIPEDISSQANVYYWSPKTFDIYSLTLENHSFERIHVDDDNYFVSLELTTKDNDYFNKPSYYFGKEGIKRIKKDYQINEEIIRQQTIELGVFNISEFEYPIHVELKKRNDNYIIELKILSREWKEKNFAKPKYYFNGILTSSAVLGLLSLEEFILNVSFSPDSYSIRNDIHIEENGHPVEKYFKQKAIIAYQGGIYEFGLFPNLMIGESCNLIFEQYSSIYNSPILHIESCRKDDVVSTDSSAGFSLTSITYRSEFPEIHFFKIEDEIYTKDEIASKEIDLEEDYELIDFLYGKTAVEELGELKYYQGVRVYARK